MDPKPRITHTFDNKANMYSKPMVITTTRTDVPCHIMQIILSIFYMHVILQVSLWLTCLAQRFSQNDRVHVQ